MPCRAALYCIALLRFSRSLDLPNISHLNQSINQSINHRPMPSQPTRSVSSKLANTKTPSRTSPADRGFPGSSLFFFFRIVHIREARSSTLWELENCRVYKEGRCFKHRLPSGAASWPCERKGYRILLPASRLYRRYHCRCHCRYR
jgi:hypothetical protein